MTRPREIPTRPDPLLPTVPSAAISVEGFLSSALHEGQIDQALFAPASLGVLLLFAGTLGFMLFSFGSARVGLRSVAEPAAPAVPLGSAWHLRRPGAPFVATALGLTWGLASFVHRIDGLLEGWE